MRILNGKPFYDSVRHLKLDKKARCVFEKEKLHLLPSQLLDLASNIKDPVIYIGKNMRENGNSIFGIKVFKRISKFPAIVAAGRITSQGEDQLLQLKAFVNRRARFRGTLKANIKQVITKDLRLSEQSKGDIKYAGKNVNLYLEDENFNINISGNQELVSKFSNIFLGTDVSKFFKGNKSFSAKVLDNSEYLKILERKYLWNLKSKEKDTQELLDRDLTPKEIELKRLVSESLLSDVMERYKRDYLDMFVKNEIAQYEGDRKTNLAIMKIRKKRLSMTSPGEYYSLYTDLQDLAKSVKICDFSKNLLTKLFNIEQKLK